MPLPQTRSSAVRIAGLVAVFFLASCFGDRTTGPGEYRLARFSVSPVFDEMALRLVDFDRVRIVLHRPGNPNAILDTVVLFPAGQDSLELNLTVPVEGASQTFGLAIAMINAANDTVFRGSDSVVAVPGALTRAPSNPVMRYVGTGSNAAGVRLVAPPTELYFQDSVTLVAEAFDSSNVTIPGTPIFFVSLDSSRAQVPNPAVGKVIARTSRGNVKIRAALLTPSLAQPDTALTTIRIQPRPQALVALSGNAQTGTAGGALAAPVVARVNAADGLGVAGVLVVFQVTGGGGTVSDDSVITDSLGRAQTTWTMGTAAGPAALTATSAGLAPATVGFTATAAPGAATQLRWVQQPTDVDAGQPITPSVAVEATDTLGNRVPTFVGNVSLAIGINPGGATLSGVTSRAAVAGVATFPGLSLNNAATGYKLTGNSLPLIGTLSAAFEVRSTTPARLAFQVEPPASVTAGATITPAVTVRILDASGNLVPTATDSVTLALGVNPGGSTFAPVTVQASGGVATFASLSLDKAGAGYTFVATRAGLVPDTTAGFTVNAGAPQVLVLTSAPPATTMAGQAFGLTVTARDGFGNTATAFAGTVSLTLSLNPGADALSGTVSLGAASGVATFTGLALQKAATGYQIEAASGALAAAQSGPIDVTPAGAATLTFTAQPAASSTAGQAIPVTVTAEDAFGNVATGFGGTVALGLAANPGGATVGGTSSLAASAGVASFTTPFLDKAAAGYTFTATAAGVAPDTSAAFAITAAAPSVLMFTRQPASAEAGIAFDTVMVIAKDAFGNFINTYADSVQLALGANPTGDTLRGTLAAAPVAGVARFTGLRLRKAGAGYRIDATAPGLAVNGAPFPVTPGPAFALAFTGQPPATAQAGTALPATVTARDSLGNTATGFTGTVSLALAANPGPGTLSGTLAVAAVAGVATYADPSVNRVATGYTLQATAGALTPDTSTAFAITPAAAAQLDFTTQPPASSVAGAPFTVVVTARDAFGNDATSFAGTVSLAFAANAGPGTLFGTLAEPATLGVATFTTPYVDKAAAGYTLEASSGALARDTTTSFTITHGPAANVSFTSEPINTTAGLLLGPVAQAAVADQYGNPVTGFTDTIVVDLVANPGADSLRGTLRVAAVNGTATFGDLRLRKAAAGYRLRASAAGYADTTAAFAINAGSATMLTFTTQPPDSQEAGAAFTTVVTAQDSVGNTDLSFAVPVTLALAANPGPGTLGGTLTVAPVSGVVTFSTPFVDRVAAGYTLAATASGVAADTSGAFTITPAPAQSFIVLLGDKQVQTAGTALADSFVARVEDGFGNVIVGHTVNVAVQAGGGSASAASLVSDAGGRVAVAYTLGARFGYNAVQLSGAGLTPFAFEALGTPAVMTKRWIGVTNDWHTATNWLPNGVPTISDDVFVPGISFFAPSGAVLGATGTVQDLRSETGSVIVLGSSTLDVYRDLDAGAIVNGPGGKVQLRGSPGTVRGIVGDVHLTPGLAFSTYAVAGQLIVTGRVTFGNSNSSLTVGASDTLVAADIHLPFGGLTINGIAIITDSLIVAGGTFVPSGPMTVGTFVQSAGLYGTGTMDVLTRMEWSAGDQMGSGKVRMMPGSSLLITGVVTRNIGDGTAARDFELGGSGVFASSGVLRGGAGTFRIMPGGVLDVQGTGQFINGYSPATWNIDNSGTLTRSTGAGTFTIAVPLTNNATVSVVSGTIALNGNGGGSGLYDIQAGGVLEVIGSSHLFPGSSRISGGGTLRVSGGTANLQGSMDVAAVQVVGGTLSASAALPDTTASFAVSGGTVGGSGTIHVTGTLTWTAGQFSGPGTTRVVSGGTMDISGGTTRDLRGGYVVENAGAGTWTGSGAVHLGEGAILRNATGGTLDITGNPDFTNWHGGATGRLVNFGTLTRNGTGSAQVNAAFDNNGTVTVQAGTLRVGTSSVTSNSSGTFTVEAGGTFEIGGGTHNMVAGSDVSGAGTWLVSNGTAVVTGRYNMSGTTQVTGGTLAFSAAAPDTTTTLDASGGTITGTGELHVTGAMTWSGSTFGTPGNAGLTRVTPGGSLAITTNTTRSLRGGYTVENAGAGIWTGNAQIQLGEGGILRNAAGATLDIQGDPNFTNWHGGATGRLVNLGALTRSTSTGVAQVNAAFDNDGTAAFTTGTLMATGVDTSSGIFSIGASAILMYNGGTHRLDAASDVSGAGTFSQANGTTTIAGRFNMSGTTAVSGGALHVSAATLDTTATLTLTGGVLAGTGELRVTTGMVWSGGDLGTSPVQSGITRVLAGGALAITGPSTRSLRGAHQLVNEGDGTWDLGGTINLGEGAILRNAAGATLDIQGTPLFQNWHGGATGRLVNLGDLTRSTSAGLANISAAFDNDGTADIQTGTLRVSGNTASNSAGVMTIASGATFEVTAGTQNMLAGSDISGAGTLLANGGITNVAGRYNLSGTTSVAAGTLSFASVQPDTTTTLTVSGGVLGGTATLRVTGSMTWTGGQFGTVAGGITDVRPGATLTISGGTTRNLRLGYLIANGGTGVWSGTHTINLGEGGQLRNAVGGTLDIQGNPTFTNFHGGASGRFANLGNTIRTGGGNALFAAEFVNDGGFDVQAGSVELGGGSVSSTSSGTLAIAAGATLEISSATHVLAAASDVSGAGTLHVNGGYTQVGGRYNLSGTTLVAAGQIDFSSGIDTTTTLTVSGGTVAGSGELRVTGAASWTSGGFGTGTISTGVTRIRPGATLAVSGTSGRTLRGGHDLINEGTATWSGTGGINGGEGAIFANAFGGNFDITGTPNIGNFHGGAPTRFENHGALIRSGAGTATMNVFFQSTGTVDVNAGTLLLTTGGDLAGSMTLVGLLDINSGTDTLQNGFSATGSGSLRLLGGTLTIAGTGNTATIENLSLQGGTIAHTGFLEINALTWTSGTFTSAGVTRSANTLAISGASSRNLMGGHVLENYGTGTWSGTGTINGGTGGIFRVTAGSTLDITGDPSYVNFHGGTAPRLEVLGTLTRSNSTGTAHINATIGISGAGAVDVQTGVLRLTGGGGRRYNGALTVQTGALLQLESGTDTVSTTLAGPGAVELLSGTLTLDAPAATGTVENLILSGGTVSHTGTLTVNVLSWNSGTFTGAGLTTVPAGAGNGLHILGTTTRNLHGAHVLETNATGLWAANSTINAGGGAVLRVAAGGDLDLRSDGTFADFHGGAQPRIDNYGTLTRTVSSGTFSISGALRNLATLGIYTGTLRLQGGAYIAGSPTVAASGATLRLESLTDTIANGITIAGPGPVVLASGTLTLDAPGSAATIDNLQIAGGTVDHAGTLSTAFFDWTSGTITGVGGTTRAISGGGHTFTISGAATRNLHGGHVLENHTATGIWSGVGVINSGQGAVFRNGAFANLDITGSGTFADFHGGVNPLFDNVAYGTVTVSNSATLQSAVHNAGTLAVSAGTLTMTGGGLFGGATSVASGATLYLNGGTDSLVNGMSITGAGSVVLNSGTLTLASAGAVASLNNFTLQGGTVSHTDTLQINVFAWTTGTLTGRGVTRVMSGGGTGFTLSGASNRNLHGKHTLENTTAAVWLGAGNILSGDSATFRNTATGSLDFQGTGELIDFYGGITPRLENAGVLLRSAGGVLTISDSLINTGAVNVAAGGLRFTGGASFAGSGNIAAGTSIDFAGPGTRLTGDAAFTGGGTLIVSNGALDVNGKHLILAGHFTTTSSGALDMTSALDSVVIGGNATFSGASTASSMNAGRLVLLGNFAQTVGNTAAFSASGAHITSFAGTGAQTVSFASAGTGASTSHFAHVWLEKPSGYIRLLNNMFANVMHDTTMVNRDSIVGLAMISLSGFDLYATALDSAFVNVTASAEFVGGNDVWFYRQSPTAAQLTVTRAAGASAVFGGFRFFSTPSPGVGRYIVANQSSGVSPPFAVTFNSPTPGSVVTGGSAQYARTGGATISWGTQGPLP